MAKSTDEHGRIFLPQDVRDRFGETYRIVVLPSHVALVPVDEDPVEGLRAALGDAFDDGDVAQLKAEARERIAADAESEGGDGAAREGE